MPSNSALIKSITATAADAGVPTPETVGKTNAELTAILSEVRAAEAAPEAEAEAEAAPEAEADDDGTVAVEADELPPYYVAPGKALTTKRGIKSDGEAIDPDDLHGGPDSLDGLIASGHIKKA